MQKNIMSLYSEIQNEFEQPVVTVAPKAAAKPKKKSIPKVVKDLSWNKWVGEDIARTKCLCCGVNEIKMSSFHCGHVVAEANGGTTTVDNLRPICAACNTSMGTENLNEFKAKCGFGTKTEAAAVAPAPVKKVAKTVKPKVEKPVVEKPVVEKPVVEKPPSRIDILLARGDLKPCPGTEKVYLQIGDIFPRSPCTSSIFTKHCSSCGYHFRFARISYASHPVCPCLQ